MEHHRLIPISCCLVLAVIFLGSTSTGVAATVPEEAEGIAFRRVIDTREVSGTTGGGAKPAILDEDVSRSVRMVYFRPNDRPFRAGVVDSMKRMILQIQAFFGTEMQKHGYGYQTFRFETDLQGEPLVHRVEGKHGDAHYFNNGNPVMDVWGAVGQWPIDLIVLDLSSQTIPYLGGPAGAVAFLHGEGAYILVPSSFSRRTVGHELGHAFGLEHDFRDDKYIMSYGWGNHARISACAAEYLSVNPFFNDDIASVRKASPATIDLVTPLGYTVGSMNIPIRVKIDSSGGLHQVFLFVTTRVPHFAADHAEVKSCRSFSNERNAVVEFDYDGLIPSDDRSSLADPIVHRMNIRAVDVTGRISGLDIPLYQLSDRHIATLQEPAITSLVFPPTRPALVSAAWNSPVRFWDLSTRQNTARFGRESTAFSVAISPDGETLATEHNGAAKLWDLSTGSNTATFMVQPGDHRYRYVAFSPPDGGTLAALSGNKTVTLWNLATRANYADLEHDSDVTCTDFSVDGERLASGSDDGMVELWDPRTGKRVSTWKAHDGWVGAIAFSPLDNGALATKSGWDGLVKFWDVKTLRHVATIENKRGGSSMAFSPDGAILACASGEVVKLWHVRNRTQVDALAHKGIVDVVAFSPDGKALASGSIYGVELWDAVEWQPRPRTMTIVSGDGQQDRPGGLLSDSLVVEVRDQYGELLGGTQVAFTVTEGSGTIGTVDATTDSRGRAATTLILGDVPGAIKVEAAVQGLDRMYFTATVKATPDFDGDGEVAFADFVLFAAAFGGSDVQFDLNENGSVDFADFILFAKHFGQQAPGA